MRVLEDTEKERGEIHMRRAAALARQSLCDDAHCGAVIVKDAKIIGEGWNAPPAGQEKTRCHIPKTDYHTKVTDKTCCVHAEVRAVMDTLRRNPTVLAGSTLYFIRVDEAGEPKYSREPYCTLCSKIVLDAGVSEFVLWCTEGLIGYQTDEYNELSFDYKGESGSSSVL